MDLGAIGPAAALLSLLLNLASAQFGEYLSHLLFCKILPTHESSGLTNIKLFALQQCHLNICSFLVFVLLKQKFDVFGFFTYNLTFIMLQLVDKWCRLL